MPPASGPNSPFFQTYTRDLTTSDLQRLFTRDTPEAYRFFLRGVDQAALARLPWHRRAAEHVRLCFLAFTLKLSPPRRAIYGIALAVTLFGLLQLFRGFAFAGLPVPTFQYGAFWLFLGFLLMNILVLLEVADRLSLKNDLDVARDIQQAMLPCGVYSAAGVEAYGLTRPANTVGGDFYEILSKPDGTLVIALGDVAGKGSPAALLMALLLAMLRALLDEDLSAAEVVERLNVQICRYAPRSRFITLFFAVYDPATGGLEYVNAGQNPPLLRRHTGRFERLTTGGMALGMFEAAVFTTGHAEIGPADLLVLYSDGVTEAENASGHPFEESGLERMIEVHLDTPPAEFTAAVFKAVAAHAKKVGVADDLTLLVLRRNPIPLPSALPQAV